MKNHNLEIDTSTKIAKSFLKLRFLKCLLVPLLYMFCDNFSS